MPLRKKIKGTQAHPLTFQGKTFEETQGDMCHAPKPKSQDLALFPDLTFT